MTAPELIPIVCTPHLIYEPRNNLVFHRALYDADLCCCFGDLDEDDDLCPKKWLKEWVHLVRWKYTILEPK
jgi:hypothetical protein